MTTATTKAKADLASIRREVAALKALDEEPDAELLQTLDDRLDALDTELVELDELLARKLEDAS